VPDTVLVTGGAGFIGSHLVDALVDAGKEVIVIDDLSSGDPDRVNGAAKLETVDITDRSKLDSLVDRASPSAIYHLAAQASVTVSVTNPLRDCQVNVEGTLNLLEGARRCRAPLVFTSTGGALYGNEAPIPTPETFIPSPLAPYGASRLHSRRRRGEGHASSHRGTRHLQRRYGDRDLGARAVLDAGPSRRQFDRA
jgi:UDP-glucose 4-epimerase